MRKLRLCARVWFSPAVVTRCCWCAQATYDEALDFMLGAEELDPGFWMMNRVTIAKAYYQLSKKDLAISWARKALELPARSQDDKSAKAEAEALLKKLGAPVA